MFVREVQCFGNSVYDGKGHCSSLATEADRVGAEKMRTRPDRLIRFAIVGVCDGCVVLPMWGESGAVTFEQCCEFG